LNVREKESIKGGVKEGRKKEGVVKNREEGRGGAREKEAHDAFLEIKRPAYNGWYRS